MKRVIIWFVLICFNLTVLLPQYAAAQIMSPILPQTLGIETFQPVLARGLNVSPNNPFEFEFIVEDSSELTSQEYINDESQKLIKYFLASLTVPEDQMWVNLSPYEKNRIVPEVFGQTEMGRDMLHQDYMLKQLVSSLMYPDGELGEQFWNEVYQKVQEKLGTTEIPQNTFNKVWIVPDVVKIFEHKKGALITEARLKVMLDEDYLAMEMNQKSTRHGLGNIKKQELKQISRVSTEVFRKVILPAVEKEVNEGKTFAKLRQIYYSMLLATWYKKKLKEAISENMPDAFNPLSSYIDQTKVKGLEIQNNLSPQEIYDQYVQSFKQGAYDLIKEEYDPVKQKIIPRKYFSGGVALDGAMIEKNTDPDILKTFKVKKLVSVDWKMGNDVDRAMQTQTRQLSEYVVSKIVNPKTQAKNYDKKDFKEESYLSMFSEFPSVRKKILALFKANLTPRDHILSIGEGEGHVAKALSQEGFQNIISVDISQKNALVAKETGVDIAIADAIKLPFANRSFDVVYINEAIGGMPLYPTLKESSRVLRSGGKIILVAYRGEEFEPIHSMAANFVYYHSDEIKDNLKKAGFIIDKIDSIRKSDVNTDIKRPMQVLLDFIVASKDSAMLKSDASAGESTKIGTSLSIDFLQGLSEAQALDFARQLLHEKRLTVPVSDNEFIFSLSTNDDGNNENYYLTVQSDKEKIGYSDFYINKKTKIATLKFRYGTTVMSRNEEPAIQIYNRFGARFVGWGGTLLSLSLYLAKINEAEVFHAERVSGSVGNFYRKRGFTYDYNARCWTFDLANNIQPMKVQDTRNNNSQSITELGAPDSAMLESESSINRSVDEIMDYFKNSSWFDMGHPSEEYHSKEHSTRTAKMAFTYARAAGLKEDHGLKILLIAGFLHDFDPTRKFNTPANVRRTLQVINDDFEGKKSLNKNDTRSILRDEIGLNEEEFMVIKAIIQRSEFPFNEASRPGYENTTPYQEYINMLKPLSPESQKFVLKYAPVFSEFADKTSWYVTEREFRGFLVVTTSLAEEIRLGLDNIHKLGTYHFMQQLMKGDNYVLDRKALLELGFPEISYPTFNEMMDNIVPFYAMIFYKNMLGLKAMRFVRERQEEKGYLDNEAIRKIGLRFNNTFRFSAEDSADYQQWNEAFYKDQEVIEFFEKMQNALIRSHQDAHSEDDLNASSLYWRFGRDGAENAMLAAEDISVETIRGGDIFAKGQMVIVNTDEAEQKWGKKKEQLKQEIQEYWNKPFYSKLKVKGLKIADLSQSLNRFGFPFPASDYLKQAFEYFLLKSKFIVPEDSQILSAVRMPIFLDMFMKIMEVCHQSNQNPFTEIDIENVIHEKQFFDHSPLSPFRLAFIWDAHQKLSLGEKIHESLKVFHVFFESRETLEELIELFDNFMQRPEKDRSETIQAFKEFNKMVYKLHQYKLMSSSDLRYAQGVIAYRGVNQAVYDVSSGRLNLSDPTYFSLHLSHANKFSDVNGTTHMVYVPLEDILTFGMEGLSASEIIVRPNNYLVLDSGHFEKELSQNIAKEIERNDAAMTESRVFKKGGIDFNASAIHFDVSTEAQGFIMPQYNGTKESDSGKIDFENGVAPVIINISPVKNVYELLGLKPNELSKDQG